MTALTDRELLRLHVEAVWEINIPPIESSMVELSAAASLPPWSLYLADLARERVTLWRPGVATEQRADLLHRAQNATTVFNAAFGMRREVVLRPLEPLRPNATPAQHGARLLSAADAALLEAFEAGSAEYFLHSSHAPCFGVVVAGQLVSVAHSSRRTSAACELGINTLAAYRRRGYAADAVRAWTAAILREDLIPIYSAFAYNTASLRLAAATGYVVVSKSVYGPVPAAGE